jgi:hypothetical protein
MQAWSSEWKRVFIIIDTQTRRFLAQVPLAAAENGHAAILNMALSTGLPLPKWTMLGAIKGQSVECLKIAHSANPDDVPKCAMVFAAAHAFIDGMRYLNQLGFALWAQGEPIDAEGLSRVRIATFPYFARRETVLRRAYRKRKSPFHPLQCCTWDTAAEKSSAAAQSASNEQVCH